MGMNENRDCLSSEEDLYINLAINNIAKCPSNHHLKSSSIYQILQKFVVISIQLSGIKRGSKECELRWWGWFAGKVVGVSLYYKKSRPQKEIDLVKL